MSLDEFTHQTPESLLAQDREAEFSGSRQLFTQVAEAFGVQLEEAEVVGWSDMLHLAYAIDEKIDVEHGSASGFIFDLLSDKYETGPMQRTQARFQDYMEHQSETRYQTIIERLGGISLLAKQQSEADTVEKVVNVRLAEADLFSYLLLLPTENMPDKIPREKFNKWLGSFSRAGYIVDSLIDIKEDYEGGSTNLRPSIATRIGLAKSAAKEAFGGLRKTPPRVLGKTLLVALKYEFQSRKPDFSSRS